MRHRLTDIHPSDLFFSQRQRLIGCEIEVKEHYADWRNIGPGWCSVGGVVISQTNGSREHMFFAAAKIEEIPEYEESEWEQE